MRRGRIHAAALVAGLLLLFATSARAGTRRIAIVVGNNAGNGALAPLHYAESDAAKLAQVLVQLGGVQLQDLVLLQGGSLAAVEKALQDAKDKVTAWHRAAPGDKVVLLFYFSGHSDGEALELGPERLPFADLRHWLDGSRAEVRIAIVDSCMSGALLAAKGGKPGPPFDIRLTDDLQSSGEAVLTSSAADEEALESSEIGGSFFTQELVSGLRGAADSSGDGRVTLAEAYRYAYTHTVALTGATLAGPQHPAYDYKMSGQGELVLTDLNRETASLELPAGLDRALVIRRPGDQVIAEIRADGAPRIAVPPGGYAVEAWRGGKLHAGEIDVGQNEARVVSWSELPLSSSPAIGAKGERDAGLETALAAQGRPDLFLALGAQSGVADGLGALASARVGVRSASASGPSIDLDVASGAGPSFRETSALLLGGYRLGFRRRSLRAFAGVELGGGAVAQQVQGGRSQSSAELAGGPWAGAAFDVGSSFSLALEACVPAVLMKLDGRTAVELLPGAWLGLLWQL